MAKVEHVKVRQRNYEAIEICSYEYSEGLHIEQGAHSVIVGIDDVLAFVLGVLQVANSDDAKASK